MLKSDEELVQISQSNLEMIQAKATEILSSLQPDPQHKPSQKNTKKGKKADNAHSSLFNQLHKLYDETTDNLTHCAIRYLLKNGCRIPQKPENSQKFNQRRRKVEIKIERLIEQMDGSIPTGRDVTGNVWLETLAIALITVPQDAAEAKSWQDQLLTQSKSLPYPVAYESNEDLKWNKNENGRLCVQFNGLGQHIFEVYCDQRQLKWFQRFYEDQQIKRDSNNQHSSALFTLRSGHLIWQEGQGKGELWNVNRLALHCTLDTQFWTEEGTAQIQQEKVAELVKNRLRMKSQLTFDIFFRSQLLKTYSTLWLINVSSG